MTRPDQIRLAKDIALVLLVALLIFLAFSLTAVRPRQTRAISLLEAEVVQGAAVARPLPALSPDLVAAKSLCRGDLSRRINALERSLSEWRARVGLQQTTFSIGSIRQDGELAAADIKFVLSGDQRVIGDFLANSDMFLPSFFVDRLTLTVRDEPGIVYAEIEGRLVCASS